MASITLKDIPDDLHAQLKVESEANYRSLTQEMLARLERSFSLQEQLSTVRVDALIEEAIASGPEEPFTREKFEATRRVARAQYAVQKKPHEAHCSSKILAGHGEATTLASQSRRGRNC